MDLRQRPRRGVAKPARRGRGRAGRRSTRRRPGGGGRPGDRGGGAGRRPSPRDRLAVDVPADRAGRGGRTAVRFQDAAPDARAVVYAAIQAEPVVARAAGLLADASYEQRLLARAVMNGETTDAAAWRLTFPTLFDADVQADELDRAE